MTKQDENYDDSEAAQRMNEAVRRALNTPHKPHKPLGKRPAKTSKSKDQAEPESA